MNIKQDCRQLPRARLAFFGLSVFALAGFQNVALADATSVTYAGHVAQIINDNCVVCHQEGGIGPMQLTSYEEVQVWAPLIQYRVANRQMPPYSYDHGIGIQDLQGDWRLSQEEIDTVVAWVDQGAPEGVWDGKSPPVPDVRDPEEWNFAAQFGQPDLIVESTPIDIPAKGNDMWHRPYSVTGLTADRCIKALQVKPQGDAKAVVHHANTSVEVPLEDGNYERYGQLTEYAMGKWGEIVPDGVCRTMPKDSRVAWDIHMYPGGLGAIAPGSLIKNNVVEVGIWFHPENYLAEKPYMQDLKLYRLNQGELIVPPHGKTMTQGFHSFDHPVRIDSFQPHGHLRMNAASLEIFYPQTGRTEEISQISDWSATWHHSHLYAPDVAPLLPTGAVLVIKQWYDNTASNPNNPDADLWVVGGSRTADEMSHAWIAVTHLDDEGFAKIEKEREALVATAE